MSEVERLASVVTMPFHVTKSPEEVDGFSFPPNSFFMPNLPFIMRDPRHFQDPEAFNPDRFIGEDGR